jgi:hypothetical protein
MDWPSTTAYVTGASRGIGETVARTMHRKGATVGLIARSSDELDQLATKLRERVAVAAADVADREALSTAIASLESAIGPPDVLVNNAGVGSYAAFVDEDPDAFERLMRINYLGTVFTTQALLPGMLSRGRGHIVNVASIAGILGAPFETAYSASKFAVVGLSEALAAEVHSAGVSVSLVNPGPVRTHFTEARGVEFQRSTPKPLRAQQVADAVVRAVERDRFEQILPRWLRWPAVMRLVAPQAYRAGVVRDTDAHRR